MPNSIKDVTLVAIDCTNRISNTIKALEISKKELDFGKVLLLSHERPESLPDGIDFKQCPKIENIDQYNLFMFFILTEYIDTPFCLTVQDHAYIINPSMWDDRWLDYDYIGAPWAYREDAYICHDTGEHVRVGNGGFSLRSKKLLDIPITYGMPLKEEQGFYNEDGNLCVYHRKMMLQLGIKYAPLKVACRFSFETPIEEILGLRTFGFHRNRPHG